MKSNYYDRLDLSKKNTYVFSVPATYVYEVDADTEEEARQTLRDKGGIDILGSLFCVFKAAYPFGFHSIGIVKSCRFAFQVCITCVPICFQPCDYCVNF